MHDHEGIPIACRRILELAERDPRRAVALARRAAGAASGADGQAAWAAYTLGWALYRWERMTSAREQLEQALAAFEPLGTQVALLLCRRSLLMVEQAIGAGPALQDKWAALAARLDAAGLPLDAARARTQQAAHLNVLDRAREAIALVGELMPLVSARGSPADQARLVRIAAVARGTLGELGRAGEELELSHRLFEACGQRAEVAKCLIERAWIAQRREDFASALADLERVLSLVTRLDLSLRQAVTLRIIGLVASRLGQYKRALGALQEAQRQFAALGQEENAANCDMTLAVIAYYSGLFDLAFAASRRAEVRYAGLGMERLRLSSLRNQALALRAQSRPAEALALLEAIEAPLAATGDPLELAEVVQAEGMALRSLGRSEEALDRLAAAEARFTDLGVRPAAADCLLEQGWVHLDRDEVDEAGRCLADARAGLEERLIHRWRADHGLGRCAELRGDQGAALDRYRAASAAIAEMRRTLASEHASAGLFAQAEELHADALRLAAALADAEAVLVLAEAQRALALQHQIGDARLHLPPHLEAEHERLRTRLRELAEGGGAEELGAALLDYTELLLRARHAAPLRDEVPAAPLDLLDLRARLSAAFPEGWTAVSFARAGDELLIVTLDDGGTSLDRTPIDAGLSDLLERASLPGHRRHTYLDLPRMFDPAQPPWRPLRELADRLLPAAVRARLCPDRRLLIVPDGPLHALPWGALRIDDAWLCQRAVVQLLPGLAIWPLLNTREAPRGEALLLGCGTFDGRAPDLPSVAAEVEEIAASWPWRAARLEGDAATRSALLSLTARGELAGYGLLHVASHARLWPSGGILAHVKLRDDDLLLDEVGQLGLQGAVVTLAACDGAAGDVLPGEEVLSLGRSLLAAGARDVLASLWPIYDGTAIALLGPFYRHLAAGEDPPRALALAQRGLLASEDRALASPLLWGCFTALGAGTTRFADQRRLTTDH